MLFHHLLSRKSKRKSYLCLRGRHQRSRGRFQCHHQLQACRQSHKFHFKSRIHRLFHLFHRRLLLRGRMCRLLRLPSLRFRLRFHRKLRQSHHQNQLLAGPHAIPTGHGPTTRNFIAENTKSTMQPVFKKNVSINIFNQSKTNKGSAPTLLASSAPSTLNGKVSPTPCISSSLSSPKSSKILTPWDGIKQ